MATLASYPRLVAQLDPDKNGALAPARIAAGSRRILWWCCPAIPAHTFSASVAQRTRGGGCPLSVASMAKEIAAEWHPTKNGALRPEDVHAGSTRAVWWKCPAGSDHEWQVRVLNRALRHDKCPFCLGRRVSITNALATRAPAVAAEWHPSKNRPDTPRTITARSRRRVWWRCRQGHEWQASIHSRVGDGTGCALCSGRRVSLRRSLGVIAPEIAAEWHPTKNGDLKPYQVTPGSSRRVWWRCPGGPDHEWQTTVFYRTHGGRKCPFCSGRAMSITNSLAARAPEIAAEWHPTRNRPATPQTTHAGANRKVWWRCGEGHVWEAIVNQRTRNGHGCPYCARRFLDPRRSLAAVAPRVAAQWHPTKNGALRPRRVAAGSHQRVWWKCPAGEDHEWRSSVGYRREAWPKGCPFCSNRRVSRTNSLAVRSPEVAREWHPTKNGTLRPEEVTVGTHRYVWWRCGEGHEFRATVKQRALVGTQCERCFRRQQKIEAAARRALHAGR